MMRWCRAIRGPPMCNVGHMPDSSHAQSLISGGTGASAIYVTGRPNVRSDALHVISPP